MTLKVGFGFTTADSTGDKISDPLDEEESIGPAGTSGAKVEANPATGAAEMDDGGISFIFPSFFRIFSAFFTSFFLSFSSFFRIFSALFTSFFLSFSSFFRIFFALFTSFFLSFSSFFRFFSSFFLSFTISFSSFFFSFSDGLFLASA